MSGKPRDLRQIQQWMQSVITHPGGVQHGVRSPAARDQIEIEPSELESVICRSRALDSDARLAIYSRAYFARLLECLRAEFPVLVHAIGEDLFDEFAIAYLQKYPSRSYTLASLAANFTNYLAQTRPKEEGGTDSQADWPDFIIDLATLEWTFSEVFDGPGSENEPVLSPDSFEGIAPEKWPEARLRPVRCLRLLSLRFPVNLYFSAVKRNGNPAFPQAQKTFVAVTRRNYVVRHFPLSLAQFTLLGALLDKRSIGEAIAETAKVSDDTVEGLANSLHHWFRNWATEGFFSGVELPRPE